MTRPLYLFLVLLGCGDAAPPPEDCERPLPATSDDGGPWPTYSAVDAMLLADCEPLGGYARRRGSCSDGKRFLDNDATFAGETYYFSDEALVGLIRWTDVVLSCQDYRFGDVRCEEVDVQEISCP